MRYNKKCWSWLSVGTLVCWFCCSDLSQQPGFAELVSSQDAKSAAAKPDSGQAQLAKVRERVYEMLKTSPALRGAWISVRKPAEAIELRTSFDVDAAVAKVQSAAFDVLLKALEKDKLLENGKYKVIRSKPRPVRQLLLDLNKRLGADKTLSNSLVAGVYFEPQDAAGKQQFLTLIGRFGTEEVVKADSLKTAARKKDAISSIVDKLIEGGGAAWRDASGKVIVVSKPDELVAIDLWQVGIALRKRLWESVRTEPGLRGVWVELHVRLVEQDLRGDKPRFDLDFIVDSDEETSRKQRSQVMRYVRSLETAGVLVAGRYLVSSKKSRPLRRLIDELQAEIDRNDSLSNSLVYNAYFEPQDAKGSRQFLTLLGRVATNAATPKEISVELGEKRERIFGLCDQLLTKGKDWKLPSGLSVADPKPDLLKAIDVRALKAPVAKYVRQALQGSDRLKGIWIDVDVRLEKDDRDGTRPTFLFKTIFDSNEQVAKTQQANLAALISDMEKAKLVRPKQHQVVKGLPRPLAQLLVALQKEIDGDATLENCVVCAGYFESQAQSGSRKFLSLEGRVSKPDKREVIAKLCERLLEANPVWSDTNAKPDPLKVVDPDIFAAEVRKRVEQLRGRLLDYRKQNLLNSAWVEVKVKLDADDCEGIHPKYEFALVVDSAQAQQQTSELSRILKETFPNLDHQSREAQRLPVSDLLSQLQDRIEADWELRGCLVLDVVFESTKETGMPSLALIGRVVSAAQRQRILDHCTALMSAQQAALKSRIWYVIDRTQELAPTGNGLLVVESSDRDAVRFFSLGSEKFRRGCYREAHASFRLAYVNDPQRWHYLYWLALCELELKQGERAYRRLKPIVWRIRSKQLSYSVVLYSLERIQFARRQRLVRLEDKILAELPPEPPPPLKEP